MSYRVEVDVHFTFQNGQAIIPLQGKSIDLMKLDTVDEFRTVLAAIAQTAIGTLVATTQPQAQPTAEPDLSAQADKIRKEFQRVAEAAHQRMAEYANQADVNPAQSGASRGS